LRGKRRDRGDEPHSEHDDGKQHRVRESRRGHRLVAEPADQREIAGHHGDLAELRERDRQRELDRLGHLVAPNPLVRGLSARGRYRSRHGHGAHHSRVRRYGKS
jgi:hypothetical protein